MKCIITNQNFHNYFFRGLYEFNFLEKYIYVNKSNIADT